MQTFNNLSHDPRRDQEGKETSDQEAIGTKSLLFGLEVRYFVSCVPYVPTLYLGKSNRPQYELLPNIG